MEHHWDFSVRSYELDMNSHVNNANYLNYFEAARMDYLRETGFDFPSFFADGYALYVSKIEVVYKAPAFLDDRLRVVTKPLILKRASGVFDQSIYRGENLICSGKITWACVNSKGRPAPIPEKYVVPGLHPDNRRINPLEAE